MQRSIVPSNGQVGTLGVNFDACCCSVMLNCKQSVARLCLDRVDQGGGTIGAFGR